MRSITELCEGERAYFRCGTDKEPLTYRLEKDCRVEFLKMLRPERKFDSLEALKRQIQADAAAVRMLENETGPCCE